MKRILIISLLISVKGLSQSEPQFNMFWNNYSMFNPANTGLHYKHYGNVTYLSQWDKVEGAPNSFTANYETKLEKINSGVGAGYLRDVIGLFTDNRFYLNYAYQLSFENSVLSFGSSLFFRRIGFNPNWYAPETGTNSSLDPNLPIGAYDTKLNVNVGISYKREKLEIGLSTTQINEPNYTDVNFNGARHYFGLLSYQFKLTENLNLKPTLYYKTDGVVGVLDLNALFTLKNKYWLGLSVRSTSAFGGQLGIDIKEKLRIGYAYDYFNSDLSVYRNSTHEITLGILLK